MKLNTALTNDFASAGFGEARRFGFEMNAMAFHAVIDGIYSDKVGAPVRELSTNAFDAHRMVGKHNVPFILMAPSTLNPFFMVRDFGPGMTHDEVMDRATTMFASNKRDTNDQVGMLGLGMKSPFAYTKQYTITCFDGAEQRDYVCYLDAGGSPTVTALDPGASAEPRGVKVMFPVQQGDIVRFRNAISKVMIGFDPMPNVLNEQWEPAKPTTLMEGSNFRIVKSDFIKSPHIRQGCVLYPLDIFQLQDSGSFNTVPLIIDVPIGTASVSTSREQLGYDEVTKQNLSKIWEQTLQDINNQIQTSLDQPDNFFDACIRYRELSSKLPYSLVGQQLKWRGKYHLRATFPHIGGSGERVRVARLRPFAELAFVIARQPTRQDRYYNRNVQAPHFTPEQMKDFTFVWESAEVRFGKDRMRNFRKQNPQADIVWIKTEDLEDFTAIYGVEDVVDLADYERLKLPRVSTARGLKKTDIRLFDGNRSVVRFDLDRDVIYVRSEGAKYSVFGKTLTYDEVRFKYLNPALNLIGSFDSPLIVLMKNQESLAKERPNWKRLEDVLLDLANTFDPKEYMRREEVRRFFNDYTVQKLYDRKDELPRRLQAVFEAIGPIEQQDTRLANLWHAITGKSLPACKQHWQKRWDKLMERYPLMDSVVAKDELLTHYLKLIAR